MKALKFIFGIFCRILACIYAIAVIPSLFIVGVFLTTVIFIIAVIEWVFTGESYYSWKTLEWLQEDCWLFILNICRKLADQ